MSSQKFIDTRTGLIVDLINLSEIQHFQEYNGPLSVGDVYIRTEPFKVGDRVTVSNGQPRPPERFNNKLASWKCRNYTGTIKGLEPVRDYQPKGALLIEPDGRSIPGMIEMVNHVRIGSVIIEVTAVA